MLDNNRYFDEIHSAFPHVGENLRLYWGKREFAPYMHKLLHDTRDGARRGFPMSMLLALHSLAELHDRAYPHLIPAGDLWAHEKATDTQSRSPKTPLRK